MATLVWRKASGGEQVFSIDRPETTIGRDPACGIRVDSAYVSKRHAVIRLTGDGFTIADLGSSNGTRVNGAPVTSTALSDGDLIELGAEKLQFRGAEKSEAASGNARHRLIMVGGGAVIVICGAVVALTMLGGGTRGTEPAASSGPAGSPRRAEERQERAEPAAPAATEVPPAPGSPEVRAPGDADAGALYDMALAHIRGGRLVEARTLLRRAETLEPGNPSVRERLREVEATLQQVIDRRLAEGQRAFTYLRLDEAIEQWEQVVGMTDSADPRHQQAVAGIERARARLAER